MVIFIAVLALAVVLARRLGCCGCCNKRRPLDVEANLENDDISAVEKNDLEATSSRKWDENQQERVKGKDKTVPAKKESVPEVRITILNEESTEVSLESIGVDAIKTNGLEARPSFDWDLKHQECARQKDEARITILDEEITEVLNSTCDPHQREVHSALLSVEERKGIEGNIQSSIAVEERTAEVKADYTNSVV